MASSDAENEHTKCRELFKQLRKEQWPIVYSNSYNITFFGMEKLHPFDSTKWGNVFNYLKEANMLTVSDVIAPDAISDEQLREFHTKEYLGSLKASKLALERGWAVNIGGGFHHCSGGQGGGFCAYADISGALITLKAENLIKSAVIIDLDAHQGNGHARDFLDAAWVHTLDIYNGYIYPGDQHAKRMKNLTAVELTPHTGDRKYLPIVQRSVDELFQGMGENLPDIIAYNAGTDVLRGDPLGLLDITGQGIIARDEIVFKKAKELSIPVFMVLSGGYQPHTARVIADSVLNLRDKGYVSLEKPSTAV